MLLFYPQKGGKMSKELSTTSNVAVSTNKMFTEEDVKTIREAYGVGATDSEFKIFMNICEQTKLNPFTKQIYFIKLNTKMTTMTSIDGLRLIAERTGKYVPGRETTYTYDKAGNLYSATSYIKKLGPDNTWHEVPATAIFAEYKKSGVWDKMPHVMLAKCAESLALRKAFPADLSGLYSEEEIPHTPKEKTETLAIQEALELVSQEEGDALELSLDKEDAEFRTRILSSCSKQYNMPITNFYQLPKKGLEPVWDSIKKRQAKKPKETVLEAAEW
jgi:phage recombination protein Bet